MNPSKVIQLQNGEVFRLPPEPTKQSEVLFSKNSTKNQYWRRDNSFPKVFYDYHALAQLNAEKTKYDQEGILISLSLADTETVSRLVDREMQRRWNGVWFMNNGKLTYLTSGHYFMLQWGAMLGFTNDLIPENTNGDISYGNYRAFQAEVHYALQASKDDKESGGLDIGKAKKTGLTQLLALDYLDESTKYREKQFGMMSKTKPDCQRTNFAYYEYGLQHLPQLFVPAISKHNESQIIFANPKKSTSIKSAVANRISAAKGFNSEVFVAATTRAAFDGPKMYRGWLDEGPKYDEPYLGPIFKATSETVKLGPIILGKIWMSAYSPEQDGISFADGKKIWYDSVERDPHTGRTPSGLNAHFVSVLDSGEAFFDIYGECDKEKTKIWVNAERAVKKKDTNDLQAFTRQFPIHAGEMWELGGGGGSAFDNIRLGVQKYTLEADMKVTLPYEQVKLEWEGQAFFSKVKIIPLTDDEIFKGETAPWRMYGRQYLNEESFNLPFQMMQNGMTTLLKPVEMAPYTAAMDPVDYVEASDVVVGSQNCILVETDFDITLDTIHGEHVSDQICLEYLYRHNNPEDDLEQLCMMCMLLGCHVYVEANKPWVMTRMKALGFGDFMIVRDTAKGLVPFDEKKHQKLPTTTKEVIDAYMKAIMVRIAPPKTAVEIDHLKYIKQSRLIDQLMGFKAIDTKKFDEAVCYGLLRIYKNARIAIRLKEQMKNNLQQDTGLMSAMRHLVR